MKLFFSTTFIFSIFLFSCEQKINTSQFQCAENIEDLAIKLTDILNKRQAVTLTDFSDNHQILLELMNISNTNKAKQLLYNINTKKGQRNYQSQLLAYKIKNSAFIEALDSIEHNNLNYISNEITSDKKYLEDLSAQILNIKIIVKNNKQQQFGLPVEVLKYNNKYFLLSLTEFLQKL